MSNRESMRYPSVDQLTTMTSSKYKLVIAVAKRAREIEETSKVYLENTSNKKAIGIALEEVQADKIIAIVSPDSAPVKRIVQESKDRSMCIDATYGRRTRSVIIMERDHVVLSAIQPETVAGRADVTEEDIQGGIDG